MLKQCDFCKNVSARMDLTLHKFICSTNRFSENIDQEPDKSSCRGLREKVPSDRLSTLLPRYTPRQDRKAQSAEILLR